MNEIERDIDSMMRRSCSVDSCYHDHKVSVADINRAIRKLKAGKSDSNDCITSDHFVNAPNDLHVHIALLLSAMLVHGNGPHDMLMSVLVPIPKNVKKSLRDSTNYRSIAISSIIGKILDNVVLYKHHNALSLNDLQFGFKPGFSTTQCTFVLEEVVDNYVRAGSMVSVVLLDASKAFDRVSFPKVFRLLMQRGLCPLVTRLLLSMYISQSMLVRWQGIRSEPFNCTNGVKQGAVLSPVLFCVYMDALLNALKGLQVGCHLHNTYAGALSYADDLTLLAPSFAAMSKMLKMCEIFSHEYDVKFNSTKSISLLYNPPVNDTLNLTLNSEIIPRKNNAIHLGNCIGVNAKTSNITKAISDLYTRCNYVKNTFKFCHISEKCRLFNSFCTSFYGSPLFEINCSERLYTCWRKCIRSLLNLSPLTHSVFLPHLIGKVDLKIDLLSRFVRFWSSCLNSSSRVVRLAMEYCLHGGTIVSKNLRFLMSFMNLNEDMLNDRKESEKFHLQVRNRWIDACHPQIKADTIAILELLEMRTGQLVSVLTGEEILCLLNELCIN